MNSRFLIPFVAQRMLKIVKLRDQTFACLQILFSVEQVPVHKVFISRPLIPFSAGGEAAARAA